FDRPTGATPITHLIEVAGKLYGTAYEGGANDSGVVFSYDITSHNYSVLVDFDDTNGSNPACGLLKVNAPVSVPQVASPQQFAIYPNPVANVMNISFDNEEPCEIIFYDRTSREVLRKQFVHSTTISTQQLANGIYTYELLNRNAVIRK